MNDIFKFVKRGLLTTTKPIDCTQETTISGFEIGGTEPSTSQRRVVFEVEGKMYRFEGNNLLQIDCEKNCAEVLAKGNTVAELLQVTDISAWCGKYIYPVIALESEADAVVMPSIKLGVKVKSFSDIFQTSDLSPIFTAKSVEGGGTASLQVRILQDSVWSPFMSVDDAVGQKCQAIQLKALQTVTSSSGSSSSQVTGVEVTYIKNADEIASEVSTLYFKSEDFAEDLSTGYILIKHNYIADNVLKVFVSFDDAPGVFDEVLGTGTGAAQSFAVEGGIDFDSLEIFVDDIKTYDFTLNATAKTLSLSAPAGSEIRAKYLYNISAENWLEAEKQYTELDTNSYSGADFAFETTNLPIYSSTNTTNLTYSPRYVYRLETAEKSKVAKVKLQNAAGSSQFEIYSVSVGFSL